MRKKSLLFIMVLFLALGSTGIAHALTVHELPQAKIGAYRAWVSVDTDEVHTGFGVLIKILTFTKDGAGSDELRIDTNLKVSDSSYTVSSSIQVDGEEKFDHSTSSTEYVKYSDVLNLTGYSNDTHTVKLYLSVNGGTGYNDIFELYKTSSILVTSNNTEVNTFSTSWVLMKTLNFTKTSDNYRIDSDLHTSWLFWTGTAHSDIRVLNSTGELIEQFTHQSTSIDYVGFFDPLDLSGYPNGEEFTVELYLRTNSFWFGAYNYKFEVRRTGLTTRVAYDNTTASITWGEPWQRLKILTFTKDSAGSDELRIDSNLHASRFISTSTAYSSIRVDGVEKFSHNTTSIEYENFTDFLDISGYSDGEHTVELYLQTSIAFLPAYNELFALYGELIKV